MAKDFQFYFNPYFWRGNDCNVKIMFHANNIGYFGVFLNRQTHKMQIQTYNDNKEPDLAFFRGDRQQQVYDTFEMIQKIWNNIPSDKRDDIFLRMPNEFNRAYLYCRNKYNIFVDFYYSNFVYNSIHHFTKFLQMLYNNEQVVIDPNYYDGMYKKPGEDKIIAPAPVNNNVSSMTRKTIEMFKVVNDMNLSNLFNGNFYPVIKQKDGYITVKDDEGKAIIVRADRGKIVPVYMDKPE